MLEHDGQFDHEQLMQAIYLSQGLDCQVAWAVIPDKKIRHGTLSRAVYYNI